MLEETLFTLLGTYAFPIAVTAFLLYERLTERQKMVEAINNNTIALTKIETAFKIFNEDNK